jgi:hypothetical protein
VLNLDGRDYLARCLPSVFAQEYPTFETLVVDNGSRDDSVAWVKANYPQVRLLENGENLGFSIANNRAIRESRGDYVLLLNNDTELEAGFLTAMAAAAGAGPRVGMVASQILFDHDPTRLDSAGIEVDWAGIAWNRHLGLPVADEPAGLGEVFGPSAAAGLYSRRMLDEIGLLDEDYFIYYEDVDLAWRGRRAGWRCLYAPGARVRHIHSGTTGQWSSFKAYLLGRNKIWTMVKNYPAGPFFWHLPLILGFELAAVGYGLFVLRDTAALRGRLAAIGGLAQAWAKRRAFAQKVTTHPTPLAPAKAPLTAWRTHRGVPVR